MYFSLNESWRIYFCDFGEASELYFTKFFYMWIRPNRTRPVCEISLWDWRHKHLHSKWINEKLLLRYWKWLPELFFATILFQRTTKKLAELAAWKPYDSLQKALCTKWILKNTILWFWRSHGTIFFSNERSSSIQHCPMLHDDEQNGARLKSLCACALKWIIEKLLLRYWKRFPELFFGDDVIWKTWTEFIVYTL